MAATRLTAGECKDRAALRLIRDNGVCTRGDVTRATNKACLDRLVRRGHVTRDANSEYSDALALTWDGTDYLGVLEESWHD